MVGIEILGSSFSDLNIVDNNDSTSNNRNKYLPHTAVKNKRATRNWNTEIISNEKIN